jgi:hypothetical protein
MTSLRMVGQGLSGARPKSTAVLGSARLVRSVAIVDRFAPEGRTLRAHLDARLSDPRVASSGRFVWDFWHVPGQYTALRTPAWTFFPEATYARFHSRLVWWGRRTLGCHDVSPPWLSVYVDGCGQELHGDLPHGPFAFVYSLTRWAGRAFRGGETEILRDGVLDWWGGFRSTRRAERPELVRTIAPRFDRLVVFDPRIPHAVRTVQGTKDPREGRVVVHGWFVSPRPFVEGALDAADLAPRIDALSTAVASAAGALPLAGLLSLGFRVSPAGRVAGLRVLSDTTRGPPAAERERKRLVSAIRAQASRLTFPRRRSASRVTLPLVFDRQG